MIILIIFQITNWWVLIIVQDKEQDLKLCIQVSMILFTVKCQTNLVMIDEVPIKNTLIDLRTTAT